MNSFGKQLQTYRKRGQFAKTSLAEKLAVKYTYLVMIENGKAKPPNFDMCLKLAAALDLSPEETRYLCQLAAQERVLSSPSDKGFLEMLGIPMFQETPSKTDEIPLFKMPKKLLQAPFIGQAVLGSITISEMVVKPSYYAVLCDEVIPELGLKKHDIAIIDPLSEVYPNESLILVNIHGKTSIKRCDYVKVKQEHLIRLSPENDGEELLDWHNLPAHIVVLGRILFTIRKH